MTAVAAPPAPDAADHPARPAAADRRSAPADPRLPTAAELGTHWASDPRWAGVRRSYTAEDVVRLRGRVVEEATLARRGAERLWHLLHTRDYVHALGALSGQQAVQMVKAGLEAIYLSGWQVAADANLAGQTYPDQSLYPANSVPAVVRRINNALLRADQIDAAEGIRTLNAARLAADVMGVPTLVVARTDAEAATLLTSDVDERDRPFLTGERTSEGFHRVRNGHEPVIARCLAYAPYADLLWVETGTPDLDQARRIAEAVRAEHPDRMLAYNCSPSFNWSKHLDADTIARFQRELGAMGYKFQFITLAGFHALNYSMFDLAQGYATGGMTAYVRLQDAEFAAAARGYTSVRHQAEVGTGYFDAVARAINPQAATTALAGSTEEGQFH
jgi:isocitrate lyase